MTLHHFSYTLRRLFLPQKRVSLEICSRTKFLSGVDCQNYIPLGAWRYRGSKATPVASRPLHSRRTASCWRQGQTTTRSGCGIRPPGRSDRSSKATSVRLWPLHSRRMASCWRQGQATIPSGCEIWPPGRSYRSSRLTAQLR